jgi:prepilin-type N-terminal cleavage/methylation domain-containing protein
MRRVRAFTLVELLVVIGIIAVLVAALLPALNRARENARRVACASNMRQLTVALRMYANDNRQRFPPDWIHWEEGQDLADAPVTQYLGGRDTVAGVFRCPSDYMENPRRLLSGFRTYDYSYAKNMYVRSSVSAEIILLIDQDVQFGVGSIWYAYSAWYEGYAAELSARHDPTAKPRARPGNDRAFDRRSEWESRGNVACCDGHVEQMTRVFIYQHPASWKPARW